MFNSSHSECGDAEGLERRNVSAGVGAIARKREDGRPGARQMEPSLAQAFRISPRVREAGEHLARRSREGIPQVIVANGCMRAQSVRRFLSGLAR